MSVKKNVLLALDVIIDLELSSEMCFRINGDKYRQEIGERE